MPGLEPWPAFQHYQRRYADLRSVQKSVTVSVCRYPESIGHPYKKKLGMEGAGPYRALNRYIIVVESFIEERYWDKNRVFDCLLCCTFSLDSPCSPSPPHPRAPPVMMTNVHGFQPPYGSRISKKWNLRFQIHARTSEIFPLSNYPYLYPWIILQFFFVKDVYRCGGRYISQLSTRASD